MMDDPEATPVTAAEQEVLDNASTTLVRSAKHVFIVAAPHEYNDRHPSATIHMGAAMMDSYSQAAVVT